MLLGHFLSTVQSIGQQSKDDFPSTFGRQRSARGRSWFYLIANQQICFRLLMIFMVHIITFSSWLQIASATPSLPQTRQNGGTISLCQASIPNWMLFPIAMIKILPWNAHNQMQLTGTIITWVFMGKLTRKLTVQVCNKKRLKFSWSTTVTKL